MRSGKLVFPQFLQLRIRHKIILAVSIAVSVAMLIADGLHSWMQERSALQEREHSLTVLTNSIAEGIEAIMMTGSTEAAISFTSHFKSIPYITDFKIIRYDGHEAFTDNKTIDQVNITLEKERYERRPEEQHTAILQSNDERLVQALDTNEIVSYYHESDDGHRLLTFLAPIKTSQDCRDCHASKRTRGVIQLTTSLSAIDESLVASRKHSALALIATLAVTILIAGNLLRRSVTGPIEQLMSGMQKISQGDLEQKVEIQRNDELGEMARIFNVMTAEIRQTQAGLRREQDKLTTIIHGADEGIVVTDGVGNVVLVNPAAEGLLTKSAAEITEKGFLELFDNPEEMQKWLKQRTSNENIINVYNNRLFQVYVSMIQDAHGLAIGSAALIRDVTEEKRLEEELRRLSTTDALTGLYNRRHMDYVLTTEFSRASRTNTPFAVMMFDIDHFKKFNDTYGHEQGDRVLQCVAKSFHDSLRKYDTACRYGGEEFLAILPHTNMDGAISVAERVRGDVENMVVDGLKVTISLGVAAYPELAIETTDQLVEAADKALYCSKNRGRNCVTRAEYA
ncbi:MAG TPA: diguanylate cyclase [Aromatoleum sp.]|uniref:diguanylate cyclase n=1 Tax=Aromatoleum sp. TaxID=2307007 RepID=UPI002B492ECE|nr:diguanylate cyclase [Aromatoleum sp.]HJV28628.1 diguanylate cyclase [Aromatoleum sp.]